MVVLLTGLTLSVSFFFMFHSLFVTAVKNANKRRRKNCFSQRFCQCGGDVLLTHQSKTTRDDEQTSQSSCLAQSKQHAEQPGCRECGLERVSMQDNCSLQYCTRREDSSADFARKDVHVASVDIQHAVSVLNQFTLAGVSPSSHSVNHAVKNDSDLSSGRGGQYSDDVHQTQPLAYSEKKASDFAMWGIVFDDDCEEFADTAATEIVGDSDYINPVESSQSEHLFPSSAHNCSHLWDDSSGSTFA